MFVDVSCNDDRCFLVILLSGIKETISGRSFSVDVSVEVEGVFS